MPSDYETAFKARLERFAAGLSTSPGALRALPADTQQRVFDFVLECACLAQGEDAVRMGTAYLRRFPPALAVQSIKNVMTKPDYMEDEYAYRRLLALCERLEPVWSARQRLVREALAAGLRSADDDVRALAQQRSGLLRPEPRLAPAAESPTGFSAILLEQPGDMRSVA